MSKLSSRDLLTPVAIIIAGAMISGSIVWTSRMAPPPGESVAGVAAPQGQPPQPSADIANVNIEGAPFIGKADAPVVMAYWFDYQCPYCKQEEETSFPQLIKDYVDTGKLKIVFKDFAFLGPELADRRARRARGVGRRPRQVPGVAQGDVRSPG